MIYGWPNTCWTKSTLVNNQLSLARSGDRPEQIRSISRRG
jgi:hypothetical protein